MSHQPFETWMISGENLNKEQQDDLNKHLLSCEVCSQLSQALTGVDNVFSNAHDLTPAPGFTQRWHLRLSEHRQQEQQRKMWFFTLGLFTLAAVILLTLFVLNQQNINWFYEIGRWIARIARFAGLLNQTWTFIRALTSALPILIPIMVVFGIGSFSVMGALIVAWFSSIIKLYQPA